MTNELICPMTVSKNSKGNPSKLLKPPWSVRADCQKTQGQASRLTFSPEASSNRENEEEALKKAKAVLSGTGLAGERTENGEEEVDEVSPPGGHCFERTKNTYNYQFKRNASNAIGPASAVKCKKPRQQLLNPKVAVRSPIVSNGNVSAKRLRPSGFVLLAVKMGNGRFDGGKYRYLESPQQIGREEKPEEPSSRFSQQSDHFQENSKQEIGTSRLGGKQIQGQAPRLTILKNISNDFNLTISTATNDQICPFQNQTLANFDNYGKLHEDFDNDGKFHIANGAMVRTVGCQWANSRFECQAEGPAQIIRAQHSEELQKKPWMPRQVRTHTPGHGSSVCSHGGQVVCPEEGPPDMVALVKPAPLHGDSALPIAPKTKKFQDMPLCDPNYARKSTHTVQEISPCNAEVGSRYVEDMETEFERRQPDCPRWTQSSEPLSRDSPIPLVGRAGFEQSTKITKDKPIGPANVCTKLPMADKPWSCTDNDKEAKNVKILRVHNCFKIERLTRSEARKLSPGQPFNFVLLDRLPLAFVLCHREWASLFLLVAVVRPCSSNFQQCYTLCFQ